jgi:hypothetical protein
MVKKVNKENEVKLFERKQIRSVWDSETEEWYFSVVDVVGALTDSKDPTDYLRKMKKRDTELSSYLGTNCPKVDMETESGKKRKILAGTAKNILRIIQSIPSKKAEPFKIWLANVGNDRINESQNPELTIERAMKEYRALGYSEEWISARLQSIQFRKELTDEWKRTGVEEGLEYAILTDLISKGWSGMTTKEYKEFKGLKKESLRDNMSSVELALNILGEASTTELSKAKNPKGLKESKKVAKEGGSIARNARKDIERRTKKSAITNKKAKDLKRLTS